MDRSGSGRDFGSSHHSSFAGGRLGRRWSPDKAWRRRADLNSLAICALLVLVAVLFAIGQSRWNDTRVNQCDAIRADVTERTIILSQTMRPNELSRYWQRTLLPQLRKRFARVNCEPPLRVPQRR